VFAAHLDQVPPCPRMRDSLLLSSSLLLGLVLADSWLVHRIVGLVGLPCYIDDYPPHLIASRPKWASKGLPKGRLGRRRDFLHRTSQPGAHGGSVFLTIVQPIGWSGWASGGALTTKVDRSTLQECNCTGVAPELPTAFDLPVGVLRGAEMYYWMTRVD